MLVKFGPFVLYSLSLMVIVSFSRWFVQSEILHYGTKNVDIDHPEIHLSQNNVPSLADSVCYFSVQVEMYSISDFSEKVIRTNQW